MAITPENIQSIYPLWREIAQSGIPYQVTLGGLDRASASDRYYLSEFIENLANHPSCPERLQLYYSQLRQTVTEDKDQLVHQQIMYSGDASAKFAAQKLVAEGKVALVPPAPRWKNKLGRFISRYKVDKWYTLLRGGLSLVSSFLDGTRSARPETHEIGLPGHILVIGWYGTETSGDKAILGGLLLEPVRSNPEVKLTVASSLPFYTEQTLKELGHGDRSTVIPYNFRVIKDLMNSLDLVCIGGGPLMDLVEMYDLLRIFQLARKKKVKTVIAGCGIGPVKWRISRWAITTLAALSDEIILRDSDSLMGLVKWGCSTENAAAGMDPAISYIASLGIISRDSCQNPPTLGMAIRDWPRKFRGPLNMTEYRMRKNELTGIWSRFCDRFIEAFGGEIRLIPMHTLHIGDDDRWYQAKIREQTTHKGKIIPFTSSYSALDVASIISQCDLMLCMRYHSLLFSTTLCIPNIFVDYTMGGKLASFASEIGYDERGYSIAMVTEDALLDGILDLISNWSEVKRQLHMGNATRISNSQIASRTLVGESPA
jgi:polysaccharide pyruvyl transferase WcaK-like protein